MGGAWWKNRVEENRRVSVHEWIFKPCIRDNCVVTSREKHASPVPDVRRRVLPVRGRDEVAVDACRAAIAAVAHCGRRRGGRQHTPGTHLYSSLIHLATSIGMLSRKLIHHVIQVPSAAPLAPMLAPLPPCFPWVAREPGGV